MKKIITFIMIAVLALALAIPAFAAGEAKLTVEAADTVKRGETVAVNVRLSDSKPFKSMALTPVYDSNVFEVISGKWTVENALLSDFNGTSGAVAFSKETIPSGIVFQLVLKVKDNAPIGATTVNVEPVIKNGSTAIEATAISKKISVNCKEHSFGQWSASKQATCTGQGEEKRICGVCNTAETKAVNALGHQMGQWAQTKAPSCTAKGEEKRNCSRSGCTYAETRSINALGHNYSQAVVTREATCTESGTKTSTCTRCNTKSSSAVDAIGHSFGQWIDTVEATCTEEGKQERKCTACNETESKAVQALGHEYGEYTVEKPATATEAGLKKAKCEHCGSTLEEVIPTTGQISVTASPDIKDIDDNGGNGALWTVLIIACVAALIFIAVAIVIIKRKK